MTRRGLGRERGEERWRLRRSCGVRKRDREGVEGSWGNWWFCGGLLGRERGGEQF